MENKSTNVDTGTTAQTDANTVLGAVNGVYKRFLLICYGWYYPNGGIGDVDDSVETEQEAMKWFNDNKEIQSKRYCASIGYQVFDCEQRKIIAEWSSDN